MERGEDRRLFEGGRGRRFAPGDYQHMGTRNVFGMHPDIPAPRHFGGQAVVLDVVAADEDLEPVIRAEGEGPHGGRRLLPAPLEPQIPAGGQFLPELGELPHTARPGKRVEHGIDIPQFLFSGGDLFREDGFRGAGLAVVLIIFLRVRGRGEGGVEGNPDHPAFRIEIINQLGRGRALWDDGQVGVDKVGPDAFFLPPPGPCQLPPLIHKFPGGALGRVGQHPQDIVRALFHPLRRVLLRVEGVEQGGEALHVPPRRGQAVLGDGEETEIERRAVRLHEHVRDAPFPGQDGLLDPGEKKDEPVAVFRR